MLDLRALSVETLTALVFGLPSDSRTFRDYSGEKHDVNTILLAVIADELASIRYILGRGKGKRPESIFSALTKETAPPDNLAFDTAEEFEAARARILRGEG